MRDVLVTIASALTQSKNKIKDATGDTVTGEAKINLTVKDIITTLIWAVGIIAVIVVIYGGILYTTSAGDPGKTKKAKDTIMYGLIGLVIALLAYTIVLFVAGQFNFT